MRQVLDLRGERRAEVELEASELNARVLRGLEHVEAPLVLLPEVLQRDGPPLRPGIRRGGGWAAESSEAFALESAWVRSAPSGACAADAGQAVTSSAVSAVAMPNVDFIIVSFA